MEIMRVIHETGRGEPGFAREWPGYFPDVCRTKRVPAGGKDEVTAGPDYLARASPEMDETRIGRETGG
jgi:hypothetical protein